jgi:hypothetical protein
MDAKAVKLDKIRDLVRDGTRSLPVKFDAVLQDMIKNSSPTLQEIVKTYAKHQDKLQEEVFNAVIAKIEPEYEQVFNDTCSTKVAKDIAAAEKKEKNLNGLSYVYGEVTFGSFAIPICKNLSLKTGGIFYDLGSGSGRGVIAAAMLHNFDKCIGIEILTGLEAASRKVAEAYRAKYKTPELKFVCADFRDQDWSDADFVFANSTCFDEQLLLNLSEQSERMKEGSLFVSLTKKLKSEHWKCVESLQYKMSWGHATVHSQIKIKGPANTPLSNYPPEKTADITR